MWYISSHWPLLIPHSVLLTNKIKHYDYEAWLQASLGLSREYLINGLEDHDVNSYYNYMVRYVGLVFWKYTCNNTSLIPVWLCFLARIGKLQRRNWRSLWSLKSNWLTPLRLGRTDGMPHGCITRWWSGTCTPWPPWCPGLSTSTTSSPRTSSRSVTTL